VDQDAAQQDVEVIIAGWKLGGGRRAGIIGSLVLGM
jgi:ATP-dependent DNA ligase